VRIAAELRQGTGDVERHHDQLEPLSGELLAGVDQAAPGGSERCRENDEDG
jgi:hypothetical protein